MRVRPLSLLAFGVVRLLEGFARSLPPESFGRVTRALGAAWYALDARRRGRALENLRVAYGADLSDAARRDLARRSMGELIRVPLEVLAQPRYLRTLRSLIRRLTISGDFDAFRADVLAGRGGLIVTGHLGNWELAARALVLAGIPARVVMRPLENPYLDEYVVRSRGGGERVIPKFGAARGTYEAVESGSWVALLADQNAGRGGRFVPFFGLPASTHPIAAFVALRCRAPLYACALTRDPRRAWRFTIHFRRLHPVDGVTEPDPDSLLARFTATLEEWVRLDPAQYNWIHRRWKSRPPGEAPGPHLPAYALPRELDVVNHA
jgi:KDO2-lipid IV(A) lauroyltransferase